MKTLISSISTHLPPTNARNVVVAAGKKARIATTAFLVSIYFVNKEILLNILPTVLKKHEHS